MDWTFAKHETFHLREGWLFKGLAAIKEASETDAPYNFFLEKDAPEKLGMGRNMVRSLRYWMQATGLAIEQFEGRSVPRLTEFGETVWQCDPYLEDEITLWLLHYYLASNQTEATSWYWFFNHYAPVSFSDKQAVEALQNWVITVEPERRVARSSLRKDVSCLLRTYLPDERGSNPENLLESPLARLEILTQFGEGAQKRYQWQKSNVNRLDPLILLYVLVDRQNQQRPSTQEVRLSQALQEPMNVGRIFNLTTAVLTDLIAALNKEHSDWSVRFVRTAGLDQLTLPQVERSEILTRYYKEKTV
jgi:hypothetical protein